MCSRRKPLTFFPVTGDGRVSSIEKGLKKNVEGRKKHSGFTLRRHEKGRRGFGEDLKGGEAIGNSKEEGAGQEGFSQEGPSQESPG